MNRYLLFLVFLLLQPGLGWSQSVWPGDVNNNGKVNAVDLLFWGVANGSTGPPRGVQSTDWVPQSPGPAWPVSFPNGINYAFADCDGNGIVDENDFDEAIEENFGLDQGGEILSDGYANANQEPGPALSLTTNTLLVEPGAMVSIGLSIDDRDRPVEEFYGIALKVSYTTGLLEGDDGLDFDFTEDAWFEGTDEAVETIFVDSEGTGEAELGLTRTNQVSVPVETGQMGSFNIIVEDIIVGIVREEFILRIDSVLLIGPDLREVRAYTDSIVITIVPDTSELTNVRTIEAPTPKDFILSPNPARKRFQIETKETIEELFLLDPVGRRQKLPFNGSGVGGGVYTVELPDLPPGPYWIGIKAIGLATVRKILIAPPD